MWGGPWCWCVEFCGLYLLRLVWFVYECPRCEVWDYVVCEFVCSCLCFGVPCVLVYLFYVYYFVCVSI